MVYIALIGRQTLGFLSFIGQLGIFIMALLRSFLTKKPEFKNLFAQLFYIGYLSLPLVALTAIFTGAVLALQSYTGFSRFNAESAVASVVVLSITRELGPVLAGLMLSGRVCAAIAAEISSMKATEQLDALITLGKSPINYLAIPRVLACVIAMPILVIFADVIGVFGGYLVGVFKLNFLSDTYIKNTFDYLEWIDVYSGLVKAVVFGCIVSITGCFFGFRADHGSQGVGFATTTAVVVSSISILLANYLVTSLMFGS